MEIPIFPSDRIPQPRENVRIEQLQIHPYPDRFRVRVHIRVTAYAYIYESHPFWNDLTCSWSPTIKMMSS